MDSPVVVVITPNPLFHDVSRVRRLYNPRMLVLNLCVFVYVNWMFEKLPATRGLDTLLQDSNKKEREKKRNQAWPLQLFTKNTHQNITSEQVKYIRLFTSYVPNNKQRLSIWRHMPYYKALSILLANLKNDMICFNLHSATQLIEIRIGKWGWDDMRVVFCDEVILTYIISNTRMKLHLKFKILKLKLVVVQSKSTCGLTAISMVVDSIPIQKCLCDEHEHLLHVWV